MQVRVGLSIWLKDTSSIEAETLFKNYLGYARSQKEDLELRILRAAICLAECLEEQGKPTEAKPYCELALSLLRKRPRLLRTSLSKKLLDQYARVNSTEEGMAEAEEVAVAAVQAARELVGKPIRERDALRQLARIQALSGKTQQAIRSMQQSIRIWMETTNRVWTPDELSVALLISKNDADNAVAR